MNTKYLWSGSGKAGGIKDCAYRIHQMKAYRTLQPWSFLIHYYILSGGKDPLPYPQVASSPKLRCAPGTIIIIHRLPADYIANDLYTPSNDDQNGKEYERSKRNLYE